MDGGLLAHDPFNIGTNEASAGWVERGKNGLLGRIIGGLIDTATIPARQMQPNPYKPGTEEAQWYADNNARQAYNWGPEMALNMIGAGGPAAMIGATPRGAIGMSGAQRYSFNDPIHKEIALRDAQRYGGQGGGKVYETQAAVDRATGYVPPQAGSYQESIQDILLRDSSNRGDLMQQYRDAMYPARNRGETMDEVADALGDKMFGSPMFYSNGGDARTAAIANAFNLVKERPKTMEELIGRTRVIDEAANNIAGIAMESGGYRSGDGKLLLSKNIGEGSDPRYPWRITTFDEKKMPVGHYEGNAKELARDIFHHELRLKSQAGQ